MYTCYGSSRHHHRYEKDEWQARLKWVQWFLAWDCSYWEEVGPVAQQKHHGEMMYMPVAISVSHLREVILSCLREKSIEAPIPSVEWIRLQFWPRNLYATTGLWYTGRFDVKFAVQCCQLCWKYPDSKYIALILQYAKEFAVKHTNLPLMISVDDKAIIPVGGPDWPILSGVREDTTDPWLFTTAIEGFGSWLSPIRSCSLSSFFP